MNDYFYNKSTPKCSSLSMSKELTCTLKIMLHILINIYYILISKLLCLIIVFMFLLAVYLSDAKVEDTGDTVDTKKYPSSLGMTIELCAGIVDKDQSLVETARDEVLEECGYDVPLSSFQKVTSYR